MISVQRIFARVRNILTPLRSPWTMLTECRWTSPSEMWWSCFNLLWDSILQSAPNTVHELLEVYHIQGIFPDNLGRFRSWGMALWWRACHPKRWRPGTLRNGEQLLKYGHWRTYEEYGDAVSLTKSVIFIYIPARCKKLMLLTSISRRIVCR